MPPARPCWLGRALALLFLMVMAGGAVHAQDGAGDATLPGWRAALSSGSERLALFSLGRLNEPDAAPLISGLARLAGGAHQPGRGLQPVQRRMSVRPILTYGRNFNGGVPGESITLGGLDFLIDPDDRAKSGVIAGVEISGAASFSYASGSILRLSASATAEALPAHDLWRTSVATTICAQNFIGGWTWLDGCIGLSGLRRSYDRDQVQRNLSFGPTTLFHAGGIDQQVTAQFVMIDRSAGSQPGLSLKWIGAVPDLGAVIVQGQVRRSLSGEQTRIRQLDLWLRRPVRGREVGLGLSVGQDRGEQVFGQDRRDTVTMLYLDLPVTEEFGLQAGLGRRNSNIELYDETLVDVSLQALRW